MSATASRSTPPQRIAARAAVLFVLLVLLGSLAGLFVYPKGEEARTSEREERDRERIERILPTVRPLPAASGDATPWFLREPARRAP